MAKVVIALSGGVDSSVAAHILKEQGHDVKALFMINWHKEIGVLEGNCSWDNDLTFAKLVARKLNIDLEVVDLSKEYKKRVVDYMFDEYKKGRTPNPDVLCNKEIKFDVFLDEAIKLDADYVATGHYCRKEEINLNGKKIYKLLAGKDNNKDQSYFLCQLNQKQLARSLFPIGDLIKPEVRVIANELKLASANKKDSQGICFVGKVDLPVFLQQKLEAKEGNIIEISTSYYDNIENINEKSENYLQKISKPYKYNESDGSYIGKHNGAHFYTIGQRKGLNIGGKPLPSFVISTDIDTNTIYVGQGKTHKGLFRKALFIKKHEIHYVREDLKMGISEQKEFQLRHRYRQPLQKATLFMKKEGLYIVFEKPQRSITSGQFAAWYLDDELIGSGIIS